MVHNRRMNETKKISVIIPVFNCIEYFPQCIDSLLAQTFDDFEIIVIDDGSTDGTYELAQHYAGAHDHVRVLRQNHQFAGAARNLGLSMAQGEYVIFLDGDDYFERTLLEDALRRIQETDADICAFGAHWLNDKTGEVKPMGNACRTDLCPPTTFNRATNPRYIFCFTTPAPWTKMFRRSFIEKNRLVFQETRSANDLRFVFSALAIADRITTLDERLVVYRRQNASSLQSTQHKDPLAFFTALTSLRDELKNRSVFEQVSHAYVNAALDMCMYNLRTLSHNREAQREVFEFLKNEGFARLGLENKPREYFYVYPASRYDDFLVVQNGTFEDYVAHLSGKSSKGLKARLRKAVRSVIPVRASVFEKSKRDLRKELDLIKEQNRNLEDKLNAVLEEIHELKRREPDAENASEQ